MRYRTALALSPLLLVVASCASLGGGGDSSEPAGPAVAGNWQQVASSATQNAFLDMNSLVQTDNGLRGAVKINYAQEQLYFKSKFSSVYNIYIMDCAGRRIADRQNSLYAGTDLTGKRINYASRNTDNLIWRDAPVASIDGELLTFACKQNVPAAPAK